MRLIYKILIVVMTLLLGFLLGLVFCFIRLEQIEPSYATVNFTEGSFCKDSIEETSAFLSGRLSTFFNYNMSNKNARNITEEEFMKNGGVCWQYADWYKNKINSQNLKNIKFNY